MDGGSHRGRPEAAAAIWRRGAHGQSEKQAQTQRCTRVRSVRWAAALRLLVMGSVALALRLLGHPVVSAVLAGVGLLMAAVVVASPLGAGEGLRRMERWLGRAVGQGLTWLLLTPFFYLVITPFGLMTRRGRRDRLGRRMDPAASTYWRHCERGPDPEGERRRLTRPY